MRQVRGAMTSSLFVIAVLLVQGCSVKWWWGSESGQEGPAQVELIKEPAIKDIPPDDGQPTDSRTSSAMQSELLSRNAAGPTLGHWMMSCLILIGTLSELTRCVSWKLMPSNCNMTGWHFFSSKGAATNSAHRRTISCWGSVEPGM